MLTMNVNADRLGNHFLTSGANCFLVFGRFTGFYKDRAVIWIPNDWKMAFLKNLLRIALWDLVPRYPKLHSPMGPKFWSKISFVIPYRSYFIRFFHLLSENGSLFNDPRHIPAGWSWPLDGNMPNYFYSINSHFH